MNRQQRRNPTKQELAKNINSVNQQSMSQIMQLSRKIQSLEEGVDFMTDLALGEEETRVSAGSNVVLAAVGRVDGKPFQGGIIESMTVRNIGSGSLIPGFEEQVIGKQVGFPEQIVVTFPETYHNKEVAGKQATFDILVIKSAKPNLYLTRGQEMAKNAQEELNQNKDKQ